MQTNWNSDLDYIPIQYTFYSRHDKEYTATIPGFQCYITRKDILKRLKKAKTVYIWGFGKYPKLVLKMMKHYKNKGKLIDENDETLQRLIAKAKAKFKGWADRLRMIREFENDR